MNLDLIKRIIQYTKPYKKYLIISLLSGIISISLTLLIPIIVGNGVDLIVGFNSVDFKSIITILLYLVITIIISSIFQLIMTRTTNIISYKTIKDLRLEVFEKLNSLPLNYIDKSSTGSIINAVINDVETVSDGLLQGFSQLFTGILTILGTLVFMISIDVKLSIVVVFVTPISLFAASFMAKLCHNMFTKQTEVRAELTGYVEEMISNQKVIKAFNHEEQNEKVFNEINKRLYEYGQKAQFYSALTNPCTRFINGIVYALVGVFGAILVVKGSISVGNLSAILTYANQFTKPFNEISGVITELQAAFSSLERVFNILDAKDEVKDSDNAIELENTKGKITIDNLSFAYDKDMSLIKDFNLDVNPGERIAIVGPTGCGKTTLINLLMRFYNINSGNIYIDNINIDTITRKSSRGVFGMVLQETWLYSGTIRENIAYGKPKASSEEIIEAAKKSHAHNFIIKLKNGYDTVLTEETQLSQGQKQLLCIARVMLSRPPILILDEATSSIDTRTEIYIQKAFDELMKGRTSFVVAHRLSTIKEADKIIVMDKGKIIEQGNHEELINKDGFYANLYNSQFAPV
ncbi:ABC transporter ATP-binding protein [Clostridium sp.]|uniref:ABC transporter ATP-binding protein n=1 Tax=Clostridium sp. TaxID=1506 RepID=UPI002624FF63|nr:ABC transporter ATP-binding protein [Clostridium sp.]